MSAQFMDALREIAEVMKFEAWLRFHFLEEEASILFVRVPEEALKHIREDYPDKFPLVETLNNAEINYEKSMSTICHFVVTRFDGNKFHSGIVGNVFDSAEFQTEMHLFNLWIQAHETQLEQTPQDFKTWLTLFEAWKNSDNVKKHFEDLRNGIIKQGPACTSDTVQ